MFMETAYEMIEGAEPIYPLEIVRRMRDQRASSIQTPVSGLSPGNYINNYLLLTISIQTKLFCCENVGIDHAL